MFTANQRMPPEVERARAVTRFYGEDVLAVARDALARSPGSRPQLFFLDSSEQFARSLLEWFAPPSRRIAEREVETNVSVVALSLVDSLVLLSTPWQDFPRTALNDFADDIKRNPEELLESMCLVTVARGAILLQHLDLKVLARGLPS